MQTSVSIITHSWRRAVRAVALTCLSILAAAPATGPLAAPLMSIADSYPAEAVPSVGVAAVAAQIDVGQFAAAEAAIATKLRAPQENSDSRAALEFQRERMRRIRLDFPLTEGDVKAKVREQIPDLSDAEFAGWTAAGLFESQIIDGRIYYFKLAPWNLMRLSAEARARRKVQKPLDDGPMESANAHHSEVRDAAVAQGRSSVAPRRLRVTQTLNVHADAVPDGKTIRAWIPYPRLLPGQQQDLKFIASEPSARIIAPESAAQRTVYLEKIAKKGAVTKFSITYELTVFAQYHAVEATQVLATPATPDLAPYLAERSPHIVFTQAIRLFSRQVVGEETNPWRIAQKLYAAVDEIPWAGAREYSTISNISDYALRAGHADCGQQTLLLMTLLRLNGIPTRWQSGMIFSDGDYSNLHDWGWLYIAPYGWLPMDVTFGRLNSSDPAIAGFYLGGLDAYRIAFNDDYARDLNPPKQFFRSETVDSQRGEVEWQGGNLYFDQWDYDFEWKMMSARGSAK